MTMRTYRYFVCPNGHRGEEKTSENDQPYSAMWESVSVSGMKFFGKDKRGNPAYLCSQCNEGMRETFHKPPGAR